MYMHSETLDSLSRTYFAHDTSKRSLAINPCPAMPGFIRGYGCFRSIKMSLNFDIIVFNRRFVDPII